MAAVREVPEVRILLLGDAEVGKSSFLSRLSLGIQPSYAHTPAASTTTLPAVHHDVPPPSYSLPALRDLDQPFTFNISMYARPYRFLLYDTASPVNYTLLEPDFIILCYDISQRETLASLHTHWKNVVEGTFNLRENIPIMVLGLKRDLRRAWPADANVRMIDKRGKTEGESTGLTGLKGSAGEVTIGNTEWERRSVMPQEALNVAQEMRCDRYAECSALTGELCREVLEDVARTAAKTTTEKGGRTEGGCSIM